MTRRPFSVDDSANAVALTAKVIQHLTAFCTFVILFVWLVTR